MVGKIFSILSGIAFINSFFLPWYKFVGIIDVSPADVFRHYLIEQPISFDSLLRIGSMIGIPILGALMLLSTVFPKVYISVMKLFLAAFLCFIHVSYFMAKVNELTNPFDFLHIIETSPGFLLFLIAIALYFLVLVFAILLSPVKGITKIVGL